MQEAYVNINDIPTHIITFGKWIEESFTNEKEIVICVTGSPGLPGFYTQFISTIHNRLGGEIPVWVIGHAGHDNPPETSIRSVPSLRGNEDKFDLDGQLKHKIDFIKTYVPSNVKIHLIGHSIGSWMLLKLLDDESLKVRVKKCYMLFPTIERMKDSPNGWILTKLVFPIYGFLTILIRLFEMLPMFVKIFIISIYFWVFSIPNYFIGTALKYAKLSVIDCVVYLAKDEMDRVTNLDIEAIKRHSAILKLYYGTTDGWVPVKYCQELKNTVPGIDAVLDNKNILHAFVLRSSIEMGNMVGDWIQQSSM